MTDRREPGANAEAPNAEQAALWNGCAGRAWVEMQGVLDAMLAPFGTKLLELASKEAPRRVLDIGCGAGATTLAAAKRLGREARCTGIDVSTPLIEVAQRRAAGERLDNVTFIRADAQTHAFEPAHFDAAISRFGVMFFGDPVAAFRNIRRAVRPNGALHFVAWRGPADNPFMTAAARAAAPFLPELPKPDPNGPGQFGFADAERVLAILKDSGWVGIEIRPLDVPSAVSQRDLQTYVTKLGPVGLALQDVGEALRERIVAAVHAAFDPFIRDGEARFTGACWLVTARRANDD